MSELPPYPYGIGPVIRPSVSPEQGPVAAELPEADNQTVSESQPEKYFAVYRSNGELDDGWKVNQTLFTTDANDNRIMTGYELTKPGINDKGESVTLSRTISTEIFVRAQQDIQQVRRQNEETREAMRVSGTHLLGRTASHRLHP